jgi:hypothetical protein
MPARIGLGWVPGRGLIELNGSSDSLLTLKRNNTSNFYIHNYSSGIDVWNTDNTFIRFATNATERARITSGGTLLVAKTSVDATVAGCEFSSTGGVFTRSAGDALLVNRQTDDGTLVTFRQDNTTEGTISVSGNTVSYNAFAGSHWSQLQDGSKPDILRGTVMESINELCEWPDGHLNPQRRIQIQNSLVEHPAGTARLNGTVRRASHGAIRAERGKRGAAAGCDVESGLACHHNATFVGEINDYL